MSARTFLPALVAGLLTVPACSQTRRACAPPCAAGYEARFVPGMLPAHVLTPVDSAPMPVGQPGPLALATPSEFRGDGTSTPPAAAPIRLSTPQAPTSQEPRAEVHLSAPANPEPTRVDPVRPAAAEERTSLPPLSVGIPQFALARDHVTSGLKPSLDGLDWLKAKGYRAVLHVRSPPEDDSADRQVVEARGLRYFSISASPETLSRAVVDEFSRIVTDPASHPLFVYDRDRALAGGLWYLHFRMSEHESDEVARLRAARLGLGDDPASTNRGIWLAIQRLLSEQPR